MKRNLLDLSGKKQSQITISDDLFAVPLNPHILSQYIRVYLSRQRQNTKKSQRRRDVSLTTAKVWRQKGTGRARHGSRKAPIFVGGAKAHGPTGQENYQLKITKKPKKQALKIALTSKLDNTIFVKDLESKISKTSQLTKLLHNLKLDQSKTTIILSTPKTKLIQSANNIQNLTTTQAARINPYEIINSDYLIITPKALQVLEDTFAPKSPPTQE